MIRRFRPRAIRCPAFAFQVRNLSVGNADADFVSSATPTTAGASPATELGVMRREDLSGCRLTRLRNKLQSDHTQLPEGGAAPTAEPDDALDVEDEVEPAAASGDLGYDDERLAQKVLEMEADGILDEAWQDKPAASAEDVVSLCNLLRELKVEDVAAISTKDKTSSFDYMLFGTCAGARHISIAAWAISEADKHERLAKPRRHRSDELWEVVPVGRIVVNLMQRSHREHLSLERKWALTESTDPLAIAHPASSEGRGVRSHGIWTLTVNLQDLEDYEMDYCKDALLRQI